MERAWSDYQDLMHQMQAHRGVQSGRVRDKPAGTDKRTMDVRQQTDERLDPAGGLGCVDMYALAADKRADAATLAAVALVRIGVARLFVAGLVRDGLNEISVAAFFINRLVRDGLIKIRTFVIGMVSVATSSLGVTIWSLPECMSTILFMRMVPAASKQCMDGQQKSHEWRDEANHWANGAIIPSR